MPRVNSSDRVILSQDEYLKLVRDSEQNKYLNKTLEHASNALHSVYNLLTKHPVLKGHSKEIERISTTMIVIDNTLDGVR